MTLRVSCVTLRSWLGAEVPGSVRAVNSEAGLWLFVSRVLAIEAVSESAEADSSAWRGSCRNGRSVRVAEGTRVPPAMAAVRSFFVPGGQVLPCSLL